MFTRIWYCKIQLAKEIGRIFVSPYAMEMHAWGVGGTLFLRMLGEIFE
jgi:hypothetical protein